MSIFPRHLPDRKANIPTNMHPLKTQVEDSSKWPAISLCNGSLNPEFRALLSHSELLVLVRNHGVAPLSVVGLQHPPQSSLLHGLENLREVYSGVPEDFRMVPISACLAGRRSDLC